MRKLTAAALPTLAEGIYPDHLLPGLNLRVGKRRSTWFVRHRVAGVQRKDVLGHWPAISLAEAREAARSLARRIDAGTPREAAPRHPRQGALSLGDLIDKYEAYRRGNKGTKTLDRCLAAVRNGLLGFLAMPAADFGKADLRSARDKIAARAPTMANRFQAYLSPVLRWATSEDLLEHDISRDIIKVGVERKRARVLEESELAAIWRAADELSGTAAVFGRLVKFLAVTGARRMEGAALRHGSISDGVWRQQAVDNKSSRPTQLRLPPLVLAIVGESEDPRALVFPGKAGVISGFSKLKRRLDSLSGVRDWRLHDLRRTTASGMEGLGIDPLTIHAVLNHKLGGLSEVYLRAELQERKAKALQNWADHIDEVVARQRGWAS